MSRGTIILSAACWADKVDGKDAGTFTIQERDFGDGPLLKRFAYQWRFENKTQWRGSHWFKTKTQCLSCALADGITFKDKTQHIKWAEQ